MPRRSAFTLRGNPMLLFGTLFLLSFVKASSSAPSVSNASASPSVGTRGVGQAVVVTLTATETGLSAGSAATINAVDVLASFSSLGAEYSFTYTVSRHCTDALSMRLHASAHPDTHELRR